MYSNQIYGYLGLTGARIWPGASQVLEAAPLFGTDKEEFHGRPGHL